MSAPVRPPSAFQMEQAMASLMAARARLLAEDPDLAGDEALLADILGSDPDTCDCMDQIHRVLRAAVHAKSMAEAAEARAVEIELRRDRYRRRAENLRMAAFAAMDALALRKIELPDLTAAVRMGNQVVHVAEGADLPDEFVRITRAPDKAKLKDALLAGQAIEGAVMTNGSPSIQIRTK